MFIYFRLVKIKFCIIFFYIDIKFFIFRIQVLLKCQTILPFLDTQIALANKYADDARKEKDMGTGTNISALLFWLPGLWATHKNVEEAVDAANRRAEHLQRLKNKKNCP